MLPYRIEEQQYPLRNVSRFQLPIVETKTYGIETVSFLGCRLWNTLPNELEKLSNYI